MIFAFGCRVLSTTLASSGYLVPFCHWMPTGGVIATSGAGPFEKLSGPASAYTAAGYGQPNANISNYTLFEIAYAALSSVDNPHDKKEVAAAIHKVNINALAGPLNFAGGPAPGVAITPPVGIQWQKGTKYPLEAKVVDNSLQPKAKLTGDLLPTNK